MVEENITRKQNYLLQLDEAIKELNAAYAEYDNIEFLINVQKMSQEEKQYLKNTINKIRLFETHAYIRLKTIEKNFNEKYKELEQIRKKIKVQVPNKEEVEELVLTYNKIQAEELEGEKFFKQL